MAKSSLEQLIEETGADPQLAKSLLIFTGGDLEGAKKILSSFEKNIGCLIVKFGLIGIKAYGIILIILNLHSNKLEKLYLTVSDNSQLLSLDLFKDPKEIRQLIEVTEVTSDFNFIIKGIEEKLNNPKYLEKLFHLTNLTNQDHLEEGVINFFTSILNELTTEMNIIVKFRYLKIDPFEMGKIISATVGLNENLEDPVEGEKKQKDEEKFDNDVNQIGFIELECEPVYSPIKGVDVAILQEGDYLKVRISDDREIAKFLAKLIINADNQTSESISAKILKKENLYENLIKITVEFGPGIYGKVICGTDVKIEAEINGRKFDNFKDSYVQTKKKYNKKNKISANLLLMVIGGIVIFIIIILLVLTM